MRFNLTIVLGLLLLLAAIIAAGVFGYFLSQFIQGFLPVDQFTVLVTLFLLFTIVVTIYGLFLLFWRQQSPSASPSSPPEPIELPVEAPFVRRKILRHPRHHYADSELESRLIRMLDGDHAAAERLVNEVRQNFPWMPENWYWEKAIEDLERDRR
ncbi:MAG: ABC transporter permease [Cyanobacteriota bacterium]